MQVFLPFPSFAHSLAVLDQARLGKQRLECRQILTALRAQRNGRSVGWVNHPAAQMWKGYESALAVYMTFAIREWEARGYHNTMAKPYDENWKRAPGEDPTFCERAEDAVLPPWLGREDFHASHRSNLLRKDEQYYGQIGWTESPDMEYVWPSKENPNET